MIDAWGKFPSGIFIGNLNEFGDFSECFHIQRGTELYQTKYCMGQVVFDLKGLSSSKLYQYNAISDVVPNVWQLGDARHTSSRVAPFFVQP